MICLRAVNVRDCCCLGGRVSIMLPEGYLLTYGWMERLGWHSPHADCLSVFDYNLVDLGVTLQVQILMDGSRRMNVGMG